MEYSGVGGGGSRTIIIILKGTRARKGNCCWQEESTSPELYRRIWWEREVAARTGSSCTELYGCVDLRRIRILGEHCQCVRELE